MPTFSPSIPCAISVLSFAILAGCGGGGDDAASTPGAPPGAAAITLTGLAATGAPLAGATVTARCSGGADIAGTTAADGSFTLALVAGQLAPCIVKVVSAAPALTLYSYAAATGRVNITPLTDLIVARAAAANPAVAFSTFNAAQAATINAALVAAKSYVAVEMTAVAGGASALDPLTGAFAVGDADDKLLDKLGVTLRDAGKTLDDLVTAAAAGASLANALAAGGAGGAGGAASPIGSGLYAAVTPAANAAFLALLPKACAVSRASSDVTVYSKCKQDSSAPAVNLTAAMWSGGLPHAAGAAIVSGPETAASKVYLVNAINGVAVGDACRVTIAEPFIPILSVELRGAAWAGLGAQTFNFNGGAGDTITVDRYGIVSEYTMTSANGALQVEMHPNLQLFDPKTSGSEGVVGTLSGGSFTGYFICTG